MPLPDIMYSFKGRKPRGNPIKNFNTREEIGVVKNRAKFAETRKAERKVMHTEHCNTDRRKHEFGVGLHTTGMHSKNLFCCCFLC